MELQELILASFPIPKESPLKLPLQLVTTIKIIKNIWKLINAMIQL